MWKRIIIHHSAADDTEHSDIEKYRRWHLERGWRDIGYHLVVERVWTKAQAIQGRPWYMAGSHCRGQNSEALGVCFAGDFNRYEPAPVLLEKGADAVASLCAVLYIPIIEIRGHNEFRNTDCPGRLFPMDRLREMVAERLSHSEIERSFPLRT